MPESKPVVDFSWQPHLHTPSLSKVTDDGSQTQSQTSASNSTLWKPNTELVDGLFAPPYNPRKLNKLLRKQVEDTSGKNWFKMPAQTITRIAQKSEVIEDSPSDFFSSRLIKKERKATLADELLSYQNLSAYRKRKVGEIEEQNGPSGNEKWNISQNCRKRAKERRKY